MDIDLCEAALCGVVDGVRQLCLCYRGFGNNSRSGQLGRIEEEVAVCVNRVAGDDNLGFGSTLEVGVYRYFVCQHFRYLEVADIAFIACLDDLYIV